MSPLLNVTIPPQGQLNWCWAAVTSGIFSYYFGPAAISQCQVASRVLNRPGCCPSPETCNEQQRLEHALFSVRCTASPPQQGPLMPNVLLNELNQRRPVCAHITWPLGGPQHFIALTGYQQAPTLMIAVQDPLRAPRMYPYQQLVMNYENGGRWDFTYFTSRGTLT
jgi:hypothetical protein